MERGLEDYEGRQRRYMERFDEDYDFGMETDFTELKIES